MTLSALWFCRDSLFHAAEPANLPAEASLSEATQAVLRHLDAPLEIHFYSILDASTVSDSVQAFSGRVDQLLAQYEQLAGGRLKIIRYNTLVASNANAAQADGIGAFNIDKGDSCFLGIAVVSGGQKESLPHLAEEWEQALEPDLSRAIARAAVARQKAQPAAPVDNTALEAVRRSLPNFNAMTLEAGTAMLHVTALAQIQEASRETETRLKEAQQRFLQAQSQQSDSAMRSAQDQLRKIQAEAANKLTQIALDSHAQIVALQQLKKAAP